MSHIREYAKRSEDNLNELEVQQILTEMNNNNNRKYEFVLKHNKKSPKKHSIGKIMFQLHEIVNITFIHTTMSHCVRCK